MMRDWMLVAAALILPAGAAAQEARSDLVESLTGCRAISDSAARLACYDNAAAAVQTARDKKEIVVLDKTEVKKTRRSLFGFSLPRIKFLEGDDEEPEPQIETKIDWARPLGGAKWTLRTAEGATWETTERLLDAPRVGDKLTIKRGALGYFIKIGGGRAVRAMRTG